MKVSTLYNKRMQVINQCLGNATLITGDMNLCLKKLPSNEITRRLLEKGFCQLVSESTHIKGGLIDHVYWLDSAKKWKKPNVERYSVCYSDHDILLITLNKT